VRLRRDRVAVALEHKVLLYNFADLKLLHQVRRRMPDVPLSDLRASAC
jgi:hypothetical protein